MSLGFFQVDAFTKTPFQGNPAAVLILPKEKSAQWMQHIAAEMNLSETGFIVRNGDTYGLRWFTPVDEVELCGHCTLASAHILWETEEHAKDTPIRFQTRSGELIVKHQGEWMEMDLPAWGPKATTAPDYIKDVTDAPILGVAEHPLQHNLLVEIESEDAVREAEPNFHSLKHRADKAIILTARSSKYDFVSRYFASPFGIDEDPVTGSAHCVLGPYWSQKLGKSQLRAFQVSPRGGEVRVRYDGGERVFLQGQAVTVLQGHLRPELVL